MEVKQIFGAQNRQEWRQWLENNFCTQKEIWLILPNKTSSIVGISYNDAVEEALCFGWIDSTAKTHTNDASVRRFTPRKAGSSYSQLNKERIVWLYQNQLIHSSIIDSIKDIVTEEFIFSNDILEQLKKDSVVWHNFCAFSDSYKRIRIAHIETGRNIPDEFEKRLNHFIIKTRANKLIQSMGSEKYY